MSNLIRTDAPRPTPPSRRGYLVRGPIAPIFVERGALAPADAITYSPANLSEAKLFERMKRAGVIRAAGGGWWLDMVAYQAQAEARSRRAIPYLIIGSILAALLLTLLYQG